MGIKGQNYLVCFLFFVFWAISTKLTDYEFLTYCNILWRFGSLYRI